MGHPGFRTWVSSTKNSSRRGGKTAGGGLPVSAAATRFSGSQVFQGPSSVILSFDREKTTIQEGQR